MTTPSIIGRKYLFAAASAALVGSLAVSLPAQAAPACTGYNFLGVGTLKVLQSDNWTVEIPVDVDSFVGRAQAFKPGGGFPLSGSPSGGIDGKYIDFTIAWDNGHRSRYHGVVMGDGYGAGERDDVRTQGAGPDNTTWHTSIPMSCVIEGPPAAARPADPNDPDLDVESSVEAR